MKIFFFSNIKQTYSNIEVIEVYTDSTAWKKDDMGEAELGAKA